MSEWPPKRTTLPCASIPGAFSSGAAPSLAVTLSPDPQWVAESAPVTRPRQTEARHEERRDKALELYQQLGRRAETSPRQVSRRRCHPPLMRCRPAPSSVQRRHAAVAARVLHQKTFHHDPNRLGAGIVGCCLHGWLHDRQRQRVRGVREPLRSVDRSPGAAARPRWRPIDSPVRARLGRSAQRMRRVSDAWQCALLLRTRGRPLRGSPALSGRGQRSVSRVALRGIARRRP